MTAYVTRAPLQLIKNPHMMSEAQRNGRRHSSRLADKEDAPMVNGIGHGYEPVKQAQKSLASGKGAKVAGGVKAGAKRKPGELPLIKARTMSSMNCLCRALEYHRITSKRKFQY